MLLHTRESSVGLWTGADTREIARTSRLVSRLTGYPVQPNKAIVGRNAFAHEAGHPPGRRPQGPHHLRDHGRHHDRPRDATRSCWASTRAAMRCATRSSSSASRSTARRSTRRSSASRRSRTRRRRSRRSTSRRSSPTRCASPPSAFELEWFEVDAGSERAPFARVRLRLPDGELREGSFTGDGPVDAFFSAINAATGHEARLKEYHVSAVTAGRDALAEVTTLIELDGRLSSGQGVSPDTIEASGRAYLRALSNALVGRPRDRARAAPPRARLSDWRRRRAADPVRGRARSRTRPRLLADEASTLTSCSPPSAPPPIAPALVAGAAEVLHVPPGPVPEAAAAVRGAGRRAPARRARRRAGDRLGKGDRGRRRASLRRGPDHAVRRRDDALPPDARRCRGGPLGAAGARGRRPGADGFRAAAALGRQRDERPRARDGGPLHAGGQPGQRCGGAAGGGPIGRALGEDAERLALGAAARRLRVRQRRDRLPPRGLPDDRARWPARPTPRRTR